MLTLTDIQSNMILIRKYCLMHVVVRGKCEKMIGILLLDLKKNKKERKKKEKKQKQTKKKKRKKSVQKKNKKEKKMGSCELIERDSEISVYLLVNNTTGVVWRR